LWVVPLPSDLLAAGLVVLSLGYGFLNGYNDAGAIIVGMIAGRALLPRQALVLAAVAELAGPFLFGVGVAATVASGIVDPQAVDTQVIAAAIVGSLLWGMGASALGMPNSLSHALVGGMVGAALSAHGLAAVQAAGVAKVLVFLIVAPVLGLILGFVGAEMLLYWLVQTRAHPEVVRSMRRWGIVSAMAFALGHGANNAQKSMGLIALVMWLSGHGESLTVPPWAVAASAICLAAGVALGGQKVIRTINARLYQLRTLHGLVAAATSAIVIFGATWGGLPISATQVASMAVAGAGAADRPSKVRWGVIGDILTTWAVTIPGTALIAAVLYRLLRGAGL
jgi:inorganic phosphate transporter, PiT family